MVPDGVVGVSPTLRTFLAVLVKPKTRRLSVVENITQDLKELLPVFAKEKTGMEITVDAQVLFWGHPDSHQKILQVLKTWFPGYDQYLAIGHWTVGRNWMGVYEGQICYGYARFHTFLTFANKGVSYSLSHESLHWLLHEKKTPSSVWVQRVHDSDRDGVKDYWMERTLSVGWMRILSSYRAKYITLGGQYN